MCLFDSITMGLQFLHNIKICEVTHCPCRHVRTLQAHSKEDEIVMANLRGEKQDFLIKAILNYILCLKAGVCAWACLNNICGLSRILSLYCYMLTVQVTCTVTCC